MAQRKKDGGDRQRIAQGVRPADEPALSSSPTRPSAAAKTKTKKVVTASARKKAPVKKAAVKKTVVKKAAAKKPPAKKTPVKKPAATKPAAKKPPAKKTPVKKPAAKKTTAKKPAVKKADVTKANDTRAKAKQPAAKKTAAKKAPAKKAPVKQPPAKKTATTKGTPEKPAAKKATVAKVAGKKSAAKPARLVVRADEKPWTAQELAEVRGTLEAERDRLRNEISSAEAELNELLRDSGDGSGDDQADAGSKTFEREHEMSVANNSRDLLMQVEHALARIGDGSYGTCESCGQPIGKARLQVFPRATLCVTCKQREERR
jgi:RNA polymerase-binding protein DksA